MSWNIFNFATHVSLSAHNSALSNLHIPTTLKTPYGFETSSVLWMTFTQFPYFFRTTFAFIIESSVLFFFCFLLLLPHITSFICIYVLLYIHNYIQPYTYIWMYPSICCLPAYTRHDLKFRIITNGRIIMRVHVYICMCVCAHTQRNCLCGKFYKIACLMIWEFVFIGSTFLLLPSFLLPLLLFLVIWRSIFCYCANVYNYYVCSFCFCHLFVAFCRCCCCCFAFYH